MKQYSSIMEYIRTMKTPVGYNSVFPIPICALSYKWREIICKIKIPDNLDPIENSSILDKFYKIPAGKWVYYNF